MYKTCARRTCTNFPASPRRSIGPKHCTPCTLQNLTSRSGGIHWACCSSTRMICKRLRVDSFFLENLLLFTRLLREAGIAVPPDGVSDLGRVLERIGVAHRQDLFFSARALFVRRHQDYPLFEL